ncbi:MAG: outer membrane lipoprotein-sorting protein [Verrucomicrobiae bacterium]|nr:outer membrane lipoprotein-sorting protein [Verrucomicrobiae bacterium]
MFSRLLFTTGLALLTLFSGSRAQAQQKSIDQLNADEVLRLVRYSYTLYDRDFVGQLRQGMTDKIPFTLSLQPNYIRFKFDNPPQVIHLNTSNDQFFLKEVVAGSDAPVPPERYGQKIRGTDVTYDDLSMRFLYWPEAKIVGEDKMKTRDCWVVRVRNPDGHGQYATVDIWVDKGSGGLMRMVGYNAQGKAIKRFEVLHGKKLDDVWMVDEMRVETFDPQSGKRLSHTYLEILDTAPTVRAKEEGKTE